MDDSQDISTPNNDTEIDGKIAGGGTAIAQKVMELEQSIKTFHGGLQLKRGELKQLRDMIADTCDQDKGYMEQNQKMKDEKQNLKQIKDELMKIPSVQQALIDAKETHEEVKDLQAYLNKSLIEYYQTSGIRSITMPDGETYEIQQSFKLVKQSSKK